MAGTYHDYYTVALAPAIAGLVVVAGEALWRQRSSRLARTGLSGHDDPQRRLGVRRALGQALSTLRWPVLVVGKPFPVAGLLVANRLPKVLAGIVIGLALLSAGTGPAAYAVQTARDPASRLDRHGRPGEQHVGSRRTGAEPGGPTGVGRPGVPQVAQVPPGGPQGGQPGGDGIGVSTELAALLRSNASSFRWVAATTARRARPPIGWRPSSVMAIGGFTGRDASPTLEQFQASGPGRDPLLPPRRRPWRRGWRIGFAPRRSRPGSARTSPPVTVGRRQRLRPHLRAVEPLGDRLARKRTPHMTSAINAPAPRRSTDRARSAEVEPVVDIVVPVHNEEVDLAPSVRRLDAYLAEHLPVRLLHHDRGQRQHRQHLVGGHGWRPSCPACGPSTLLRRAAAGRSRRSGPARRRRCWPTWMSICPPTCAPCCRWSRR